MARVYHSNRALNTEYRSLAHSPTWRPKQAGTTVAYKRKVVMLAQLNAVDEPMFVATIGPVFEHSPWIAAAAWRRRPFADGQALHAALCAVVDEASEEQRIALIIAHPDLAGRVAREGRLTAASLQEQSSAGLAELAETERQLFEVLNAAYRARFGFPFVICAREHSKASILSELARRAGNARGEEIAGAIDEIKKIAWLRLSDQFVEGA